MAECLVLPVLNNPQTLVVADHVLQPEEAAGEFALELEDVELDETAELADDQGCPDGMPVPDPLQVLIEDLSGISGSLREPTARATKVAEPDLTVAARLAPPRIDVPEAPTFVVETQPAALPLDLATADLAEVGAAEIALDPQPGDPAALLSSGPKADAAGSAEARPGKPAVLPVMRQIAEAVVTTRDDIIEIALAPEELGKIRMVMSGTEQSPHMTVWVERPEVLDQLRRNSAVLQECLGDAGMAGASFEFHGETSSGSGGNNRLPTTADRPAFDPAEHVQAVALGWTSMTIPTRLDIRI